MQLGRSEASSKPFSMNYAELANPGVLNQPVYEPGKPIDYVAREYGLDPAHVAKLASNENPFGPSPKGIEAGRSAMNQVHLYPDGGCRDLREAISRERGVSADSILVGNGSNEMIELLGHAFLRPGVEAIMGSHAFIVYKLVAKLFGATPVEVPMQGFVHDLRSMQAAVTDKTRLLFVASPNNPTGGANSESELLQLAKNLPEQVIFCFDEAYAEYLETAPDLRRQIEAGRKVICMRTFSKIYGLGGLRLGYAYGDPELIALLQRVRQPFNVNSIAQAAAIAALEDDDFVLMCRRENEQGRELLCKGLQEMGIETFGGSANFVLSRVGAGMKVFHQLQERGIIVRPLAPYGMPEYVRITIGRPSENKRVLESMSELLETA